MGTSIRPGTSGAIKVDGHEKMYFISLGGHPSELGEWLCDEIDKESPITEFLREHPRFNRYFKSYIPDYFYKITDEGELLVRKSVEFDWRPIS